MISSVSSNDTLSSPSVCPPTHNTKTIIQPIPSSFHQLDTTIMFKFKQIRLNYSPAMDKLLMEKRSEYLYSRPEFFSKHITTSSIFENEGIRRNKGFIRRIPPCRRRLTSPPWFGKSRWVKSIASFLDSDS